MKTWDDRTEPCPNCGKYLDDHIIAENVAICVSKTHTQPLTDDDGA